VGSQASFRVSFGPFELDLDSGELRKYGNKIRLQDQPFLVLKTLIESPGEVVGKERLHKLLWPEDVFVDFDHGLNSALTKLRVALGDSAEKPRYIETVARRGYRFIGKLGPEGAAPVPKRIMLAVLPFENLSDEAEQEFFSEGMTEEMITQLGRLDPARLGVIARTSSMQYKKTTKTAAQIGEELKVDYVLEGSIRRAGNRIRITAQLIKASDQTHVWTEKYDRTAEDVLVLQTEAAEQIARSLALELLPEFRAVLARSYNTDAASFDLYLRGRHHWNQRSDEGFNRALEYFHKVVERDPRYAPAYAGIADTYSIAALYGTVPAQEAYQRAKAAATKALEIDDRLAEAHTSLAWARLQHDWDWAAAEVEHLRALELNPNYATGRHWYALNLAEMSRFDQALREIDRALELDPLSRVLNTHKGWILYFARRYDEALEQLRKTVQMEPSFALVVYFLGLTLEQMGNQEAVATLQRAVELSGRHPGGIAGLSHACARFGDKAGAVRLLQELTALQSQRHVSPYFIAVACAGLGENDRAFEHLEQSFEERSGWMVHLTIDPQLDSLHSDPRFASLVTRVGLYQAPRSALAAAAAAAAPGESSFATASQVAGPAPAGEELRPAATPLEKVAHPASGQEPAPVAVPKPVQRPAPSPSQTSLDETEEFEFTRDRDWHRNLLASARLVVRRNATKLLMASVLLAAALWLSFHFFYPAKTRVMVLPLENTSGDAAQLPFTQGMTDELTAELDRINPQRVGVIARTTAMHNAGRSIRDIRKDLSVDYLVEGGVLRIGNRVRITVELTQSKDESRLWTKTYEEDATDVFELQRRVAVDIANSIAVTFHLGPLPGKIDPQAHDAFLRGRYFWNRRGLDTVQKSMEYFQAAIRRDPSYARPYAGLADAYAVLGSAQSGALPPDVAFPKAREAALKSIQLDPNLAEPHASLGLIKIVYDRDPEGGRKELQTALKLDPGYVTAHQWMGQYYIVKGDPQQAIAAVRQAYDLEPTSLPVNIALTEAYYFARNFDRAIEQGKRTVELDPNAALAHFNLGRAYEMKNLYAEALAEFQAAQHSTASPATLASLGYALGRAGRKEEALKVLADMEDYSRRRYVPAMFLVMIYAGMDDRERMLAELERAKAEHSDYLGFLRVEPMADPFRSDPRFEQILK